MAGFEGVGQLLGDMVGGGQELRLAEAATQGRYRSARTEQALASARKGQADAIKAEQTNQIMTELLANAPDMAALTNQDKIRFMAGGIGDEYANVAQGDLRVQEHGYRGKIADAATVPADQQRYRAAVGDAPFNPVDAVGTRGAFTDARNPDLGVQKPIGEDLMPTDPTSAIQNYEYGLKLPEDVRPGFEGYVRNSQIVNAGGVPVNAGLGGAGTPKEVVPAAQVAQNAGNIAQAKTEGQGQAKRALDLPSAKSRMQSGGAKIDLLQNKINKITNNEALWAAVGVGQPLASIPSTEGAYLKAQLESLKYNLRFTMLQDLRDNSKTGGAVGNVSNEEGRALENAIAALDPNLHPEDLREQLQILGEYFAGSKQRLQNAFLETYPELRQAPAAPGATPAAPAAGGVVKWTRDANGRPVRAQ